MKNNNRVAEWVYKAEEDYEVAHVFVRKRGRGAPDSVCFHAQQCAEKYIKGFLVSLGIPFPKIHDLYQLINLVIRQEPLLLELRNDLLVLNPFSVRFRYPGDRATKEDAREAFQAAKRIRTTFRIRLGLK